MGPDNEYTIFDQILEAAQDVLNPMIDQGVLTCSSFNVSELARRIVQRTMEIMNADDGLEVGDRINLTTPVSKRA